MKVSVCIPTYNSADYIRECVASVLSQNGVDFEVIIFDNASDDGTWEIIQSLSDTHIKAFRSDQNRGMAVNFNRALDQSQGEYIKLLCSDDRLEPSALELQTRFMDEHLEASMVTSSTRLIDRSGHPYATVQRFFEPIVIDANHLRASSLIYGNIVGEPSAVLFRRESWLRAGPFKEGLVTLIDLDMWFRLSQYGGIGYLPFALCQIRRHPNSMTNQFRGAGKVQEAVLRMTEALLGDLHASSFVRRVCLGKVAGSHLQHALYGMSRGQLKWPASALAAAFQIDPFFAGLFIYIALFRTELMGLKVDPEGHLSIGTMGTLNWVSTAS